MLLRCAGQACADKLTRECEKFGMPPTFPSEEEEEEAAAEAAAAAAVAASTAEVCGVWAGSVVGWLPAMCVGLLVWGQGAHTPFAAT